MIRTRLLWFSLGLASTSAAISKFVVKGLWIDRSALPSQLKEKFSSLEARVSTLESSISEKPT